MKIKRVESFTLEECQSYLEMYPGESCHAVKDRMKYLLEQIKDDEEQKEQEENARQEYYENDVKWIDIKQFLAVYRYRDLRKTLAFFYILLLGTILFLGSTIYFTASTHMLYSSCADKQAVHTAGLEKFLLNIKVIEPEICLEYPTNGHYRFPYESREIFVTIIVLILWVLGVVLITTHIVHTPKLNEIYNIEREEKVRFFRRTQNCKGLYGLHRCRYTCAKQVLPFVYKNIYYCGGNSYICVLGNKKGVYNTALKRMVLEVAYDSINIMQDGTLATSQNGVVMKYTTEGYRVIE